MADQLQPEARGDKETVQRGWLGRKWDRFWGKVECKTWRTQQQYMEDRVQHKINQYVKKARHYKWSYWVIASLAALGAVLVPPLLSTSKEGNNTTHALILGAIVAGFLALDGVFRPREHWRNYDTISFLLRAEEMYFSTRSGPYANKESPKEETTGGSQAEENRTEETNIEGQTCGPDDENEADETGDENQADESTFRLFVERVEAAIAKERGETIEMRTKPPEKRDK